MLNSTCFVSNKSEWLQCNVYNVSSVTLSMVTVGSRQWNDGRKNWTIGVIHTVIVYIHWIHWLQPAMIQWFGVVLRRLVSLVDLHAIMEMLPLVAPIFHDCQSLCTERAVQRSTTQGEGKRSRLLSEDCIQPTVCDNWLWYNTPPSYLKWLSRALAIYILPRDNSVLHYNG